MSRENVELVLKAFEAFNRGDLASFLSVWHPEGEYRAAITQAVEGEAGVFRGHIGLREWWDELHDLYDDLGTEIVDVRDQGEQVVVVFVIRGRGKGSGIEVPGGQELAQVVTVRAGAVVGARDYFSRTEALEAVGLRE